MGHWAKAWYRTQFARYRYRRGLDDVSKGNYQDAIARFTEALDHHPQPAQIYVTRGITRWQAGDVQNALADLTQATHEDPLQAKAYGNRGLLRYELGDEQGALEDWGQALTVHPRDARVHYNRALLFLQKQNWAAALEDLNQALEANPNLAEAYYHRGNARYELGDCEGAVADWELAVCNDLRLEQAKVRLQQVHRHHQQDYLSQRLQDALTLQDVTVVVHQSGERLDITLRRPQGVGINYFTLPNRIREKLIDWQLPGIRQFQLTGKGADQSFPEWQQVYSLYQGQPCPPVPWRLAGLTTLLFFPPLGIAALIYAYRVGDAHRRGDYPQAVQAAKTAKGLCLTGIALASSLGGIGLGYLGFTRLQSWWVEPGPAPQPTEIRPSSLTPILGPAPGAVPTDRPGSFAHTFQRVGESRGYLPGTPPDSQA